MSRRRFYATRIDLPQASIEGRQAHHLAQVLRAKPGQLYDIAHGGRAWLGRIAAVSRERIIFDLLEELSGAASGLGIELAASIVRFDPFEWMLEKATELGAAQIHPLVSRRTEPHLAQAAVKRADRWERLLIEATQQSRRAAPPGLSQPRPLQDFLGDERAHDADGAGAGGPEETLRLIASELGAARPLRRQLEATATPPRRAVVLIGPEGGWAEEEVEAARAAGFLPVSLGPRVLRAETAALATLAVLQCWWEPAPETIAD